MPDDESGRAMPQDARESVPDNCPAVVVTAPVEGWAQASVISNVSLITAKPRIAPLHNTMRTDHPVVDRAEAGCGQGGEDAWVGGHRVGDTFAAGQSGPDELIGVRPVQLGSRDAA
jgi:hypothetical protein